MVERRERDEKKQSKHAAGGGSRPEGSPIRCMYGVSMGLEEDDVKGHGAHSEGLPAEGGSDGGNSLSAMYCIGWMVSTAFEHSDPRVFLVV